MKTLGIDIGGTYLRIGMIDKELKLSCFEQVSQTSVLGGDAPRRLAEFISGYLERSDKEKTAAAVCVGFPAAVNRERSIVLNAPCVPGFDGIDIKKILSDALGLPVFIEKDVNLLIQYDLYVHSLPEKDNIIACYVGTGIGNAIMINGQLLTGFNGVSGELGHIPVLDSAEICDCGNIGCAEMYTGGKFLAALKDREYTNTPINKLFAEHGSSEALKNYLSHLAAVIAAEINIIDPAVVILGGGVLSMEQFPKEELEAKIRQYTRKPQPEASLKFVFSENKGENGVIGAGIYAHKEMKP